MLVTDSLSPIPWWNIVLRLGIVLLVSTIIGFDRVLRAKLVGLRVYMLVSLGSAFFVLVPLQLGIFQSRPALLGLVIEGIITGVSAIAAGMSFSPLRQLRAVKLQGLTLAFSIWLSSGLGIAFGCGLWQLELVSAVLYWLVLRGIKQPKTT